MDDKNKRGQKRPPVTVSIKGKPQTEFSAEQSVKQTEAAPISIHYNVVRELIERFGKMQVPIDEIAKASEIPPMEFHKIFNSDQRLVELYNTSKAIGRLEVLEATWHRALKQNDKDCLKALQVEVLGFTKANEKKGVDTTIFEKNYTEEALHEIMAYAESKKQQQY